MSEDKGNRRDFLYVATAGTGAVIGGAAVWPMINQMNPSADVQALSSIEVDVSDVESAMIMVEMLKDPTFYKKQSEEAKDSKCKNCRSKTDENGFLWTNSFFSNIRYSFNAQEKPDRKWNGCEDSGHSIWERIGGEVSGIKVRKSTTKIIGKKYSPIDLREST